jgi:hypothetical protein
MNIPSSAKVPALDTLGGMCRRAQCQSCNRPTYKGCGNHVEQVLGDVPTSERCHCAEERRQAEAARPKRSWFGARSAASRQLPANPWLTEPVSGREKGRIAGPGSGAR